MADEINVETLAVEPQAEAESQAALDEGAFGDAGDDAEWDSVKWPGDDAQEEDGDGIDGDGTTEAHQAEDGDAADGPKDAKAEEKPDDSRQEFELKFNHESVKVGREEAARLAQKGLNYDKVHEELTALKADVPKFREMEKFLNELKGDLPSIEALVDQTRASVLKDRDEGLSDEQAMAQAKAMRGVGLTAPEAKPAGNANDMIDAFVRTYPNVKAEEIPQSVWDEVKTSGDLVGAYSRYEAGQLQSTIQSLKEEIEILKQNQKNSQRSAGSSKTSGASSGKSMAALLWDSDE